MAFYAFTGSTTTTTATTTVDDILERFLILGTEAKGSCLNFETISDQNCKSFCDNRKKVTWKILFWNVS